MRLLKFTFALFSLAMVSLAQQNETLLIGPGDALHILVFDTPEMEQHPHVTDSGEIPLMFVGNIKVAGLSPAAAATAIEDALKAKQYMLHPQVTVTVDSYATQQVSIMGQVFKPGTYDLRTPTPILRVLSLAGGLADNADRNITIERHSEPGQKVSYFLSNQSNDAIANEVLVNPGDTVVVPKLGIVYILGDVLRPGGYPLSGNNSKLTLLQAVALAGSLNHTAIINKTRLIRTTPSGVQDVPIDLKEMEKGAKPDIELQANDILFVPFSWMKNMVLASSSIATSAATALIYAHP